MFEKALSKIGNFLNRLSIPYMIIGGQAVLMHGEPRLTRSTDITLGIGIEDLMIHKIFVGRPRDMEDVRIILLKKSKIDAEYIIRWLSEFDKVSDKKVFVTIFKSLLNET